MINQGPLAPNVEKTAQPLAMTASADDLTLSLEEKQLILTLDRCVALQKPQASLRFGSDFDFYPISETQFVINFLL